MKILELTNYSAGGCGVWQRAKQEAELLSKKGHKVMVFSSNAVKGSMKKAAPEEKLGKIQILRFPFKKLGGESFMSWDFKKEFLKFKPDIVVAHSYRHPHTTKALKLAKKINAKVFLVTHAPFERTSTRSFFSKMLVNFYDFFIGPKTLNKFERVLAITKWEVPFLHKLGARKITYIPNGISEDFFNKKKEEKEKKKIIFLGRVTPIKNLETLIRSIVFVKDKKINLEIVGPAEKEYLSKLIFLIKKLKLEKRVKIENKIFNREEQINKLDSSSAYILPSISEGMPQALIEAMARSKKVIASSNPASRDLIKDGKEGLLFETLNPRDLASKIDLVFSKKYSSLGKNAQKSVEDFKWNKILSKLEGIFSKNLPQ